MHASDTLARCLAARLGGRWTLHARGGGHGCVTWRADSGSARCFVKTAPAADRDRLAAEADGLAALAATGTVRVPAVLAPAADDEGLAWLALEWLDLASEDAGFGARFGAALGALHRAAPLEGGGRFGWRRDNWLGATPQPNAWSAAGGAAGWMDFLAHRRLGALRDRLGDAAVGTAVDALIAALPRFFADGHVPRASLIHGDLWSGNWGMLADGTPVVFDPAVSCSDAEAELAMMELFGVPPPSFWPAYRAAAGLHAGYPRRAGLYRLVHLLNHAVLFGGGWRDQALALARRLAAAA
jgi:fructosamine-3-kinase